VTPTEGPCRSVFVTVSGQGTVVGPGINCLGDCVETYPNGAMESWTAMPNMGETFLGWTNCPSGAGNPVCSATLTSNLFLTATFSGATAPPPGGGGTTTTPATPKKKCKKGQKLKKGKCVKKKRKKK
jgi:hypothetical protein